MLAKPIAIVLILFSALAVGFAENTPADPCAASQQRQFDFWIGTWKLSWPGDKPGQTAHGTNHILRILNGCVLQENFDGGSDMHLRGTSVSTFDTRSGKWKQTWVDNEGGYLDFVGELRDGQMILSREGVRPDGAKVLQRMVWKNIAHDEFDWSWEASDDGGKTWQVKWPIHYVRQD